MIEPPPEGKDPDDVTVAPDGQPMALQPAWRQDFPIDWPKDHYIGRRDFARFLALTSFAFVGGHAWIAAHELVRRHRATPPRTRICSLAEIPIGAARLFSFPGPDQPCLLLRPDETTLVAYSQACTHLSCPVVPRMAEGLLVCPCHNGSFDVRTGKNLSGPPPRPLGRVELEITGGEVYALAVEPRLPR